MPEGPSIVIAKEAVKFLTGKKVTAAHGNAKIDLDRLAGKKVTSFKSWGKHFLICFDGFFVRIHFMMFGSYLINERKSTPLRMGLEFGSDELNFYTCSVAIYDGDPDDVYDWDADIMSGTWDAGKALKKVKASHALATDILLDQQIFSGSGNIIKNEVLYRVKIHPLSHVDSLPPKKIKELVDETRNYAFDFLKWKKEYTLSRHWLAYKQKTCKRCDLPFHRTHLGNGKRLTFYCNNCQVNYDEK